MNSYILLSGPVMWLIAVLVIVFILWFIFTSNAYIKLLKENESLKQEKENLVSRLAKLTDKHYKETFKYRLRENGAEMKSEVNGR